MRMNKRLSLTVAICVATLVVSSVSIHAADAPQRAIQNQPSLILASPQVELAVTQLGGHRAPVTFFRDTAKPVQPYYVSPWQTEAAKEMPAPVLVTLRGDFFCMPFGGNQDAVGGKQFPPHGETAGSAWKSIGLERKGPVSKLTMSMDTPIGKGKVVKELALVDGQNVVYLRHLVSGYSGRMPLGHHATLAMPDREGAVRLATSPIRFGMTYPGTFSDPTKGEYQSLLPGSRWTDLTKVPVSFKGQPDADLSRLPARVGFADLVQLINEPSKSGTPAWTTATFADDGYVWFALKDPSVLVSTVFWIENHGRHGHPWNGRNNCLGLEDVTAYFADGLAASTSDNILNKEGVATSLELKSDKPTAINYIQGVAKIPAGFDIVKTIDFGPKKITLVSASGQKADAAVDYEFLKSGQLP